MGQAKINNNTAFKFEALFTNNEAMRPIFAPIVKATLDIMPDGHLKFVPETQLPISLEGEHYGDPETSSYKYEPECVFIKPGTDVVIIGSATSGLPVYELLVDIQVGQLRKSLWVIGNRFWVKEGFYIRMTAPQAFERMPITYENAFGGWDRNHPDPAKHGFEPRNTVGKGFYCAPLAVPMPLPNIEDPQRPIRDFSDRPTPAGCGFTLPHWEPRKFLAGTYDKAWLENRNPLLPLDFKREFFNAASPGLIAYPYLQGGEYVRITNMSSNGKIEFILPKIKPLICEIELRDYDTELTTNLDTVIINTETRQLTLIWRNHLELPNSPHDVAAIALHYG